MLCCGKGERIVNSFKIEVLGNDKEPWWAVFCSGVTFSVACLAY